MAFLIDLPVEPRRQLAERWQSGEATDALYRTMTDRAALRARVEEIDPLALRLVAVLSGVSLMRDVIASRVAASDQRVDAIIESLARLAIVLEVPGGPQASPRFVSPPYGEKLLYIPSDVSFHLRGT